MSRMLCRLAVANGVETMSGTPEQFRDFIRSESVRFGKVIKAAGSKGD